MSFIYPGVKQVIIHHKEHIIVSGLPKSLTDAYRG